MEMLRRGLASTVDEVLYTQWEAPKPKREMEN